MRTCLWFCCVIVLVTAARAARADAVFFPPANCTESRGQNQAMAWDGVSATTCTPIIYDGSTGSVFLNANVGIGTATPAAQLQVTGSALVANWGLGAATGAALERAYLNYDGNTATAQIVGSSNVRLSFGTNGTVDQVVVDIEGNVGIGSMSPQSKLDVTGDARVSGDTRVSGNLGLKVMTVTCSNGQGCDQDGSAQTVTASCPGGYTLTGCTPGCYDTDSIRLCGGGFNNTACWNTCQSGGSDHEVEGSACNGGIGVTLQCMRITDIGDN